jgi:hypothetical protein
MEPPHFAFKELITHVIGDIAKAVCDRPNESPQQRFTRIQATTHMMLELRPRDVIEAMLCGQTVMFHEMLTDSVHETLRGQVDTLRRATRANIVAISKAFHQTLERLEHYQARRADGMREATAQTPKPVPEPLIDLPPEHEAEPAAPATPAQFIPSPDQIAACRANPAAMAALDAGDAAAFARALGIDQPSQSYLTAADKGSVFNETVRSKSNGHAHPSR